jgi:hypothetical protein
MKNSIGESLRQTLDKYRKHERLEELLPDYTVESDIVWNGGLKTNTLRCNVYDKAGEYCCPVVFLLNEDIEMAKVAKYIREAFGAKGVKSPLPTSTKS